MAPDGGPHYYVYGVTAAGGWSRPDVTGIGDPPAQVLALEHGDLAVLLSPCPDPVVDPSRANAVAHEKVLAAAMQERTVVPFAFGHVMRQEGIRQFLDATGAECHRLLALFAGKIEVGLRVFWKKSWYLDDIETPEIHALSRHIPDLSAAPSEPLLAQFGALVQEATEARRAHYVKQIYEPLAGKAVDARLGNVMAPRMVLSAAFLIQKSQEAEFDRLVGEVAAPLQSRLEFSYTGPWPPHHFVTLRIQAPREEDADAGPG